MLGSLTTVENEVKLDELGQAAVATTASRARRRRQPTRKRSRWAAGMELAPDPDRRLTLTDERDALGMPRLKLTMRVVGCAFRALSRRR